MVYLPVKAQGELLCYIEVGIYIKAQRFLVPKFSKVV